MIDTILGLMTAVNFSILFFALLVFGAVLTIPMKLTDFKIVEKLAEWLGGIIVFSAVFYTIGMAIREVFYFPLTYARELEYGFSVVVLVLWSLILVSWFFILAVKRGAKVIKSKPQKDGFERVERLAEALEIQLVVSTIVVAIVTIPSAGIVAFNTLF